MEHWRVVSGGMLASTVKCPAMKTSMFPSTTTMNILCAVTLMVVGRTNPMIAQVCSV